MPLTGEDLAAALTTHGVTVGARSLRDGRGGFTLSFQATLGNRSVDFDGARTYSDAEVRGLLGQLGVPGFEVHDAADGGMGTIYEFSASLQAEVHELGHDGDDNADVYLIRRGRTSTHWEGDRTSTLSRGAVLRLCCELQAPLPQWADAAEAGPGVALDHLVAGLADEHGQTMNFTLDAAAQRMQVTRTVFGAARSVTVDYHAGGGRDSVSSQEVVRICDLLGVGVPQGLPNYDPNNLRARFGLGRGRAEAPLEVAVGELAGGDDDRSTEDLDLNEATTESVEVNYRNRGRDARGNAIETDSDEQETEELHEEQEDPGHVD